MDLKLVADFGCDLITQVQIDRLERLTGKPAHRFLRRGIFVSHRDFDNILDDFESGRKFYIYTGRGPSAGSLHLGHLVPFLFTAYLQQVFKVPVVIQITDDEKLLFRGCTREELKQNTESNIKDIIACGFDPTLTFVFSNFEYMGTLYPNVIEVQSRITNSQAFKTFGIKESDNIGRTSFCATQIAPVLSTSFPHLFGSAKIRCLVPQGVDQDPYFRLARDVAPKMNFPKPSLIHSRFMCSLRGPNEKMSSSDPFSAIFMSDTPPQIKKKINACFSGGRESKEEQLVHGADLDVDVAFQYLTYFLEDGDELKDIRSKYGPQSPTPSTNRLLTSDVKRRCIEVITQVVLNHQQIRNRQRITWDNLKATFKHIEEHGEEVDEEYRLQRHPFTVQKLNDVNENLRKRGLTVKDNILHVLNNRCVAIQPNEYPYDLEDGIKHWLVWGNPEYQMKNDDFLDLADEAIREEFSDKPVDLIWFQNPKVWQSIPDVLHVHLFTRPNNPGAGKQTERITFIERE